MKLKRKLVSVLLVINLLFLTVMMTACGETAEERDCQKLIDNLETSINARDLGGILDCMNPTVAAPLKDLVGAFKMGEDVALAQLESILGVQFIESDDEEEIKAASKSFEIKNEKFDINDERGTVSCTLSYEGKSGSVTKDITFKLVCRDNQWYINGVE